MRASNEQGLRGVRGWLLLLCGCLLVWQPANLGIRVSHALPSLPQRGVPLGAILILSVAVTAVGFAAGLSLLGRRRIGVELAVTALLASATLDLVIFATPYMPNNRMPGDTPFYVLASLLYHGGWLLYLGRSRRVAVTCTE